MEDYLEINKLENICKNENFIPDYDTAYFYWNITNNRGKYLSLSEFDNYLSDKNMSFKSISSEKFKVTDFRVLNDMNPYNIYNESDIRLILSSDSNNRKYCYNEAFYLWMKRSVYSHEVLLNRCESYFNVESGIIKDIVRNDSMIFYYRMKDLRDNYPDYFPIRSQSSHIFNDYIEKTINRNEYHDRQDDMDLLMNKYKGRIIQVDELDLEYDCAKNYYINNLIIKYIIGNVLNKKI